MTMLKSLPRWLLWVAGIVLLSLAIDYWQVTLLLAVLAGTVYGVRRYRAARVARHAACLTDIARMERELGIGTPWDMEAYLAQREAHTAYMNRIMDGLIQMSQAGKL